MRKKNRLLFKDTDFLKEKSLIFFNKRLSFLYKNKFYKLLFDFYGISFTRIFQISGRFGCLPFLSSHFFEYWSKIEGFFDSFFYFGRLLEKDVSRSISEYVKVGSYRGIRLKQNLPVRGQRTHTNARTMKRKRQ